jgi:DNA repair photolyase
MNKTVLVPPLKSLIKKAPGFAKKGLATYKLDIIAKCGFGCRYCSSNTGNYLRIHSKEFAACAEVQLGKAIKPKDDPSLMLVWPDVVGQLGIELKGKSKEYGFGETLMFSMLTDGFSPYLVNEGITRAVLELILMETSFRIRVLTKNAIVGSDEWIQFFGEHKDRFVVGLSTGSLDDDWSQKMELGTSCPSERFEALKRLQTAGIPTFGMLCPVFPDMLDNEALESMIDMINPSKVEHIWAEPYNDRINWKLVQSSFSPESSAYKWFTKVYEQRKTELWSMYATDIYLRLKSKAVQEGWISKLRYLLYENNITVYDAQKYCDMEGLLLQNKPGAESLSKHSMFSEMQTLVQNVKTSSIRELYAIEAVEVN